MSSHSFQFSRLQAKRVKVETITVKIYFLEINSYNLLIQPMYSNPLPLLVYVYLYVFMEF